MLDLALREAGGGYRVEIADFVGNDDRDRSNLEQRRVDVVDFGTSPEFERKYAAVYFPIDRGLNGWRFFLVRDADEPKCGQVRSLADLRHFVVGQGQGWSDIPILTHAGLQVVTTPALESLFPFVSLGRCDFVPLGINEIYSLYERYGRSAGNLQVDQHVVLVYPFARFFFVRKDDQALRDAIYRGLQKAFDDGSFAQVLESDASYRKALDDALSKTRVRINIDNPELTERFRQIPERYFVH
jgi:hypothetical protein